jgi:hypothetical protein
MKRLCLLIMGARRVKVTVTRTAGETATGSATVARGRYTVTVRSRAALSPGRYATSTWPPPTGGARSSR